MSHFWNELKKPILGLAPMADVTDPAFREIIATYGKPDVFWTEFVSADGIYHTREIAKMNDKDNPLMKDLQYTEKEHPIVAQVFTNNIEYIQYVSKLIMELGFDGIDINMGCPHKAIEKQGAGAALIKTPERAVELMRAVKEVVGDKIPLSVKTRIGYNKNEMETWLPILFKEKPDCLTLHARTRKEMSNVPARWEHVARAVELRDMYSKDTVLLGNGDVKSVEEAHSKAKETGADGVMIGRGIFGNPWLFANVAHTECGCNIERPLQTLPKDSSKSLNHQIINNFEKAKQSQNCAEQSECVATQRFCKVCGGLYIDPVERLRVLIEHCKLFDTYCAHKSFAVMKKHFKAYVNGFDGARELRVKLFDTSNTDEVTKIIDDFLK